MSKKSHAKAPNKKTGHTSSSTQVRTKRAGNKGGKRQSNNRKSSNKEHTSNPVAKNFNEIRHEIFKFGLSGLEKKEQVDARVELAIKLGARPKKWIKPCSQLSSESRPAPVERPKSVAERVRQSQFE